MKFTMNKDALQRVVLNAGRIINPKSELPDLACVYFSIDEKDKALTVIASDGEMWLTDLMILESVEGNSDGDNTFLVYYELLKSALSEIPPQPLEVEVEIDRPAEKVLFTITHESGSTTVPGRLAYTYPLSPEMDDMSVFQADIEYGVLKRALQRSLQCVDEKGLRPALQGVLFDFLGDNKLNVVATDGRCMVRSTVPVACAQQHSVIVPNKVAKILPSLLNDEDPLMFFDETRGHISFDNADLIFLQVEAKYPNYESVIPKQRASVKVGRLAFIRAASNVTNLTSDDDYIEFNITEDDKMTLKGENEPISTEATDSIDIEPVGDKALMKAAVKGSWLVKILKLLGDPKILLHYSTHDKAFTFTPDPEHDDEEVLLLLMPMMLK